jgi:hypothetical protein
MFLQDCDLDDHIPARISFRRKSYEIACSSSTRHYFMSFGCNLPCCVNFGRDYLSPHLVSLWIILRHNQFQSQFTLLRFISAAVIFHSDQFRP